MRSAGIVHSQQTFEIGFTLHQQGRLAEAERLYREVVRGVPRHAGALHSLGVIALQTDRLQDAVTWLKRSISVDRQYAPAHNNLGYALWRLKKFDDAVASYSKAIALDRNYAEAYNNRGNAQHDLGRLREALASFDKAIALRPDYVNAHNNRGVLLKDMGHSEEALASYDRAIALDANHIGALSNRGQILIEFKRLEEALASCERAIALDNRYAEAHCNRGNVLEACGRFEEALASFERALLLQPENAVILNNKGNLLQRIGQLREASISYEAAAASRPDLNYLAGNRILVKLKLCDWTGSDDAIADITARIKRGMKAIDPFAYMAMVDSVELQGRAAEIWVRDRYPSAGVSATIARKKRPADGKIRIGYFSADFREHAIAYLTAGLFEAHDRAHFEIVGFSFGPASGGATRERIERAFDEFIDIRRLSDGEAARLARDKGIDIAVDLTGFTEFSRTGVFAHRAAPIQVNYLGYPGTIAADYIDYIVADPVLIPQTERRHYREKVVYLPHTYQANDDRRRIADHTYTRGQLGLPDNGFVFCCFNVPHKITPTVFASWMRILAGVPGSVLWLFTENTTTIELLRGEAARLGVSPDRLIFAGRMPLEHHLARHRAADLFLDALPYNAHTTASDALWAGLPVLTRIGESFPARVAASLLHAVGLPEMIVTTPEEYEALAIALAQDPDRLMAIKSKLHQNRLTAPLFDTALFARHIENAFAQMIARYDDGLPPDHIFVAG